MNLLENSLEDALARLGRIMTPERFFAILLFILGGASLVVWHSGVFPLSWPYALFYLVLLILFGLYRPHFLWMALVFFLPFELLVVTMLPGGVDVRAYQFGMAALGLATLILWWQHKITIPTVRWFDAALALLLVGGVVTFIATGLPMENAKDLIILFSFAALYALGRIYLRTKEAVKVFLSTLLLSASVVGLYALYQAVAFQNNGAHFMVMAGRPNSVFEEADWLGFFMGLSGLVALVGALWVKRWYQELLFGTLFMFFVLILILTVSRSAWLGFAAGVGVLVLILAYDYVFGFVNTRLSEIRSVFKIFIGVPVCVGLALGIISLFSLTSFELDERAASTGGQQLITVACVPEATAPESINHIEELLVYGCQHINLEEVTSMQSQGYQIAEVERPDPNIAIRKNLYQETWTLLKEHFFLGLGWGESLEAFGTDGRGAGLNSSNIFLEIWLGSGLIGLFGFLFFWFGILAALINRLLRKREMTEGFWLTLLMLALWCQVTIFNVFNAGILLAVFSAYLMLAAWYGEKTIPYSVTALFRKV